MPRCPPFRRLCREGSLPSQQIGHFPVRGTYIGPVGEPQSFPDRLLGETGQTSWDMRHFVRGNYGRGLCGEMVQCPDRSPSFPRSAYGVCLCSNSVPRSGKADISPTKAGQKPDRMSHFPRPPYDVLPLLAASPRPGIVPVSPTLPRSFPDRSPYVSVPHPDKSMAKLYCITTSPYEESGQSSNPSLGHFLCSARFSPHF